MAGKRFRLKFMFWLDMNKSDEIELAEEIEILKQQRLFSETIRDGIRLMCDLRAGRTDRLFAMFPWLTAEVNRSVDLEESAIQHEINSLWKALAQTPRSTSTQMMDSRLPAVASSSGLDMSPRRKSARVMSGEPFSAVFDRQEAQRQLLASIKAYGQVTREGYRG